MYCMGTHTKKCVAGHSVLIDIHSRWCELFDRNGLFPEDA